MGNGHGDTNDNSVNTIEVRVTMGDIRSLFHLQQNSFQEILSYLNVHELGRFDTAARKVRRYAALLDGLQICRPNSYLHKEFCRRATGEVYDRICTDINRGNIVQYLQWLSRTNTYPLGLHFNGRNRKSDFVTESSIVKDLLDKNSKQFQYLEDLKLFVNQPNHLLAGVLSIMEASGKKLKRFNYREDDLDSSVRDEDNQVVDGRLCSTLLEKCTELEELVFYTAYGHRRFDCDNFIHRFITTHPVLKKLELHLVEISIENIHVMMTQCPNLKELSLQCCKIEYRPDLDLSVLSCGFQNLEAFGYYNYGKDRLVDEGTVIEHMLRSAVGIKKITKLTSYDLRERHLREIATSAGKQLKEFYFDRLWLNPEEGFEDVPKSGLRWVAECCPNIEKLRIASWRAKNEDIGALAQGCVGVRRLELCDLKTIGDEALEAIAKHCTALVELTISDTLMITNKGMEFLAALGERLKVLELYFLRSVTDEGIMNVTKGCTGVQEIVLRGMDLTDGAIQAVADNCSQLVKLDISNPTFGVFGEKPIMDLVSRRGLGLEQLSIGYSHITDACVEHIVDRCETLRILNIANCRKLTNAALHSLARGLPKLMNLHIRPTSSYKFSGVIFDEEEMYALQDKRAHLSQLSGFSKLIIE